MMDQLAVPYRMKMIRGFRSAANAAKEAGAFGTTISGSGSTIVSVTRASSAGIVSEALAEGLKKEGNHAVPFASKVVEKGITLAY